MRSLLFRIPLALLGAVMIILGLLNPLHYEEAVDLSSTEETLTLKAGDSRTWPLRLEGNVSVLAVTVQSAEEGRGLTLQLRLRAGNQTLAEQEFSLARTRPFTLLRLSPETPFSGPAELAITAVGEGAVQLKAEADGTPALWVRRTVSRYGLAWIWCGGLLVLLALIPVFEKGGKACAEM